MHTTPLAFAPASAPAFVGGEFVVNFGTTALVEWNAGPVKGLMLSDDARQRWYANPEKCRPATDAEVAEFCARRYGR